MAHGSAVAWQHLNLLGEYDFSDEKLARQHRNSTPKIGGLNGVPSWGSNGCILVSFLFELCSLPLSVGHAEGVSELTDEGLQETSELVEFVRAPLLV